jgi:hypothetical protein
MPEISVDLAAVTRVLLAHEWIDIKRGTLTVGDARLGDTAVAEPWFEATAAHGAALSGPLSSLRAVERTAAREAAPLWCGQCDHPGSRFVTLEGDPEDGGRRTLMACPACHPDKERRTRSAAYFQSHDISPHGLGDPRHPEEIEQLRQEWAAR